MIRLAILLAALGITACGAPRPPVTAQGDTNDPRFQSLVAYVQDQMERYDIPGASIAIVEDGKLTSAAGVGKKRAGASDAVGPATLFRAASLSKMVLASTAMNLVEEGRLDVSQPVSDYVPLTLRAPFDPASISVAQLLTHTSGIPDFGVSTSCATGPGQIEAWFDTHGDQPLWTPPGEVWNYSNQGFAVAGWIIEAASGQVYEDAVTERVFDKAGMTSALFDPAVASTRDHAIGHDDGIELDIDAYDCAVTRPPAGVIASAIDYAHFAETLLAGGGSMLSPASVAAMETGYIDTDQVPDGGEHYGYGINVRDGYKGLRVLRHEGSDHGYQASIWMVPAERFAVIVLYNANGREPKHVSERAVDLYLGVEDIAAPVDTTPTSTWQPYVGTYEDPFNLGQVVVRLDGEQLHGIVSNTDLTLTQDAGDVFGATFHGQSGTATFYPGPKGPAQWLVTRSGVAARQ